MKEVFQIFETETINKIQFRFNTKTLLSDYIKTYLKQS
jgi:hypothetical protein